MDEATLARRQPAGHRTLCLRGWSVRQAALLERLYERFEAVLVWLGPRFERLGYRKLERPVAKLEAGVKGVLFGCRMCGQCALSTTGMSCPMGCPKQMRNGPCGGVRQNGGCEVHPEMPCVWVEGWKGSRRMRQGERINEVAEPLDHQLWGSSSWLRAAAGMAGQARGAQHEARRAGRLTRADEVVVQQDCPEQPLEALLRSGEFVVTSEITPPDSPVPDDLLKRAEPLRGLADALNVTDGAGARPRLSSIAACAILARDGYATVTQISCRDRNRIAVQGDVLGAAALGLGTFLCLTGDGVEAGDHPDAKPVFDLDSLSLLETLRVMRDESRYRSGRELSSPPSMFLGAVENPFTEPVDFRPLRLAKKVAAGARFIQTQFCFDVPRLRNFMSGVRDLGMHDRCFILAGVGPLASARSARWIRDRVAGVHIPDQLIRRLVGARDERAEGIRICLETIAELQEIPGLHGVHVMAYPHAELAAEIIERSGLAGRRTSRLCDAAAQHDLPKKEIFPQ